MKKEFFKNIYLTSLIFLGIACNISPDNQRGNGSNFASSLNDGEAYIISPTLVHARADEESLPLETRNFSDRKSVFITNKTTLSYDCLFETGSVTNCFQVAKDEYSAPLARTKTDWNYDFDSEEFLQVNLFAHAKKLTERFYSSLSFAKNFIGSRTLPLSTAPALPLNTLGSSNNHWLTNDLYISSPTLKLFTFCPDLTTTNSSTGETNTSAQVAYIPSKRQVCFSSEELFNSSGFNFSQDPDAIYHEMGHVMIDIMMNLRNETQVVKSALGLASFDEAGSINEGLADYFTYMMTEKTSLAPWSLGNGLTQALNVDNAIRPLSESNSLHISGVSLDNYERLSYPQYVNYNVHHSEENDEDIHNEGQIVSHFLTSLTKDLKNTCSIEQDKAEN